METTMLSIRRRPPGIEEIIKNKQTWSVFQFLSGTKYAGHEKEPRRLPKVTLHDYKKKLILQQKTLTETWHIPDALYFIFANNQYSWNIREAITVQKDHFWWLIDKGDTVLLSDSVTHHYTGIREVDRKKNRIYFSDQWPEFFFLRKGLNTKGIEADDQLSVSRDDFLKVIVGMVTLDIPDLLVQYMRAFPKQKMNLEFLRQSGLMLLDDDRDSFAQAAATYLTKALLLAQETTPKSVQLATAAEAYLALKMTVYQNKDFPLVTQPYNDKLQAIITSYGLQNLHAQLKAEDLGRIAYTAGNVRELGDAKRLFGEAIAKDPEHEYNHHLYATSCLHLEDHEQAIEYASIAIKLNRKNQENLETSLKAIDSRDYFGIKHLEARRADLDQKYVDTLIVRCNAYLFTQRYDLATHDADSIIHKQENNPLGYVLKAKAAEYSGELDTALTTIEKAASLEEDPSKLNFYLQTQEFIQRKKDNN